MDADDWKKCEWIACGVLKFASLEGIKAVRVRATVDDTILFEGTLRGQRLLAEFYGDGEIGVVYNGDIVKAKTIDEAITKLE